MFVVRHGARQDKDGAGSMTEYTSKCEPHHEHDTPLSIKGEGQALRTGEFIRQCLGANVLATKNILMVSSPLRRCLQTTNGIRRGLLGTASATNENSVPETTTAGGSSRVRLMTDATPSPYCHLQVCTGFYELFVENLFPAAPRHIITPTLDVSRCDGRWEERDGGGQEWESDQELFQSVAVDDQVRILERYPETKPQSTSRSVDAFQEALRMCSSTHATGHARDYEVLIIVAHQFNCHVIASKVVETVARHREMNAVDGDQPRSPAAARGGKGRHIDWKKEARRLLAEIDVDREEDDCDEDSVVNGRGKIPLQQEAAILDFDVCSVSLFEFDDKTSNDSNAGGVPTHVRLVAYKSHLDDTV